MPKAMKKDEIFWFLARSHVVSECEEIDFKTHISKANVHPKSGSLSLPNRRVGLHHRRFLPLSHQPRSDGGRALTQARLSSAETTALVCRFH